MKPELNRPEDQDKSIPQNNPDQRRGFFDEKYSQLLKQDVIFKKIFNTLDQNWSVLSDQDKTKILNLVDNLLIALRIYHRSRLALEGAAHKKNDFYKTTAEYQEDIKAADIREHVAHKAFIGALNMLSRIMAASEVDNSWRKDDRIYGLTPEAEKEKTREWMLEVASLL